jgi:hypothetical protein
MRGATEVRLAEPVEGWRAGDRVIVTATARARRGDRFPDSVRDYPRTEERTIAAINEQVLLLDSRLDFDHIADGAYCGEVANLSRNVIVESANPHGERGHVMYHMHSSGSISYAEFRHLGKEGKLGRYNLHFHQVRDTMRGSSVVGASFWDSDNRWLTLHGTDYLVVRDCVGYRSTGHGFFLEDGTEAYNALDRNLAVQACRGKPLPKQTFSFDKNEGAGFWWANSLNSFTENVAAECDQYGFRFEMVKTRDSDPVRTVRQPDGSYRSVDVRELPFIRFENNEAHCQRVHAFNLGGLDSDLKGGVAGVGPDSHHPFEIRGMRVWDSHWAFHPRSPSVMVDGMDIYKADYGVWRPIYVRHAYRSLTMKEVQRPFAENTYDHPGNKPNEAEFPRPLDPVDDFPPFTVITQVERDGAGRLLVRGTTCEGGAVRRVTVNNREAKAVRSNFLEWEILLKAREAPDGRITAFAEDAAGNRERQPHVRRVNPPGTG